MLSIASCQHSLSFLPQVLPVKIITVVLTSCWGGFPNIRSACCCTVHTVICLSCHYQSRQKMLQTASQVDVCCRDVGLDIRSTDGMPSADKAPATRRAELKCLLVSGCGCCRMGADIADGLRLPDAPSGQGSTPAASCVSKAVATTVLGHCES